MTETIVAERPVGSRIAVLACFTGCGSGIGAWAANLPALKESLGLSASGISLALLSFTVGSILAMPTAGWLARFGTHRIMLAACAAFAAGLALPGLALSLPILCAIAFFLGVSNGFLDVSMNAYATVVQRAWGAPLMSSFHAAFSFGGLLGAGGVGMLLKLGLAPAATFGVAALWAGALVVLAACTAQSEAALGESEAAEGAHAFMWPTRALFGIGMLCFLAMLIEGALADWSGIYLATVAGASTAAAAAGYAAFSVTMACGRLVGDRVTAGFGGGNVLRWGASIAGVGLGLSLAFPWPAVATLGFALVGMGVSNVVPLLFSAAGRAPGTAPAMGIAMAATVGYAGFLLGPPTIGFAADAFSLRIALIVVLAAAATIAVGAGRVLPK